MPLIEIDKDGDSVIFTTDGKSRSQSVRREDTVISVPPEGYGKVFNIYVDLETERLVISYE